MFPPIYARDNADDNVAGGGSGGTIGIAIEALPDHQALIVGCIPDYRRLIKKFIQFINEDYHTYYEQIVFDLSPEQRENKGVYYNATQDLRYNLLNPQAMQMFMSANKQRPDGKDYSYDHMRKYHDAILYCSILAKVPLPDG